MLENSKDILDFSQNDINNYNNTSYYFKKFIRKQNDDENLANEEKEKLKFGRIETIKNELEGEKINCEFLKKKFKMIKFVSRNYKKEKHLMNIFEVQNLQIDSQEIWISKFRQDGKYLATAGKSGTLRIWEALNLNDSLEEYIKHGISGFFKFFKDFPFRIYKEHTSDIIDLSWSNKVKYFFKR